VLDGPRLASHPRHVGGEVAHAVPFDFRGLRCLPSRLDPYAWFVVPRTADIERDESGRPQLTMIDLGSSGYLIFTARWAASASDLDALKAELAASSGPEAAGRITLSFAPIRSPRCDVLLGDPGGAHEVIASSSTSGYPPFNAAFNIPVEGDRLAAVKAAMDGRRDVLRAEYRAELPAPTNATARFQSTTGDFLPWLRSGSRQADLRTLLEEAIRSGRAEIQIDMTQPGAGGLVDELYERALARAEQMLPRWLAGEGSGDVRIEVAVERLASEPVRAGVDIGEIAAAARQKPA
jgi:hypothetical protein